MDTAKAAAILKGFPCNNIQADTINRISELFKFQPTWAIKKSYQEM